MEKELNIAAILKDKPKGTKLWSPIFGECTFDEISCDNSYFGVDTNKRVPEIFYANGKYDENGECTIFPSKEMRDWRKFQWKKGDVLVSKDNVYIIFEKFEDDAYTKFRGKHYLWEEGGSMVSFEENEYYMQTSDFNKANKEEAQTYINTIEEKLGGKLNRETLVVEKTQPEFKDGDILSCDEDTYTKHTTLIFHKDGDITESIVSLVRHSKLFEGNEPIDDFFLSRLYYAREDEKKELFDALAEEGKRWDSEKKQIVDLKPKIEMKPFDKVLCRDDNDTPWKVGLFSHLDGKMFQCVGSIYRQCIPYEGNEYLLGTTKEVEG